MSKIAYIIIRNKVSIKNSLLITFCNGKILEKDNFNCQQFFCVQWQHLSYQMGFDAKGYKLGLFLDYVVMHYELSYEIYQNLVNLQYIILFLPSGTYQIEMCVKLVIYCDMYIFQYSDFINNMYYILQIDMYCKKVFREINSYSFFLVGGDDSPYLELIAVNHQKCYDSIFTIFHVEKQF